MHSRFNNFMILAFFQQDMNYDGVTTVMRFLRTRIPMRKIDDDKASGNKLEIKLRRNGTGDCMRIELIACGE